MADLHDETKKARVQAQADGLAGDNDAVMLAHLGYKQELRRKFTVVEMFGIAFSIMGIVPSIASTLVFSIPAGPAGMVWGWFIAGGFIFIVGLAMADLGSSMPTSGGLYYWTHYFSHPKYRNALSFLVGYSNTLGLIGGIVGIDYGFSQIFLSVIAIAKDGTYVPSSGVIYAVFLATVICHGILASTLNKVMNKLQTVFVVLNFILIVATIIALPVGRGSKRNDASFIFTDVENLTTWPKGWAFMLAMLAALWTINGYDSPLHLSEEAVNATRAVPYGILMAIGNGWIFGWIVIIVIAACMDPVVSNVFATPFGQPMAQIYYDALGKNGAIGFMTVVFVVQFSMGLSVLVSASRQSWAFSRDGALPFSNHLRKINVKMGYVPIYAIWGCVSVAAVIGLLTLIAPAAAQACFSLGVSTIAFTFAVPIACRVIWGQEKFKPGPFYTGKLSVPIAWIAVIFLSFTIILGMFPFGGPTTDPTQMNYTVVIDGAVWLGAMLYYFLFARKWFTGPKVTLPSEDSGESKEREDL